MAITSLVEKPLEKTSLSMAQHLKNHTHMPKKLTTTDSLKDMATVSNLEKLLRPME